MSETTDIKINELMNKIVQCTGGKRVAILEGFVSSMDEDIIKLHPGLNPSRYVEIPRDSLLHSTTIDDELGNRCKLWVEYDTKIVMVRRDIIIINGEVADSETGVVAMIDIFKGIPEKVRSGFKAIGRSIRCRKLYRTYGVVLDLAEDEDIDDDTRAYWDGILSELREEIGKKCPRLDMSEYGIR